MSEMVDRVARALTAEFESGRRVFDEGEAEDLARAAIAAMREPTEEMANGRHTGGERISSIEAACVWRDMIDEALV
jgi:hypothetical protein